MTVKLLGVAVAVLLVTGAAAPAGAGVRVPHGIGKFNLYVGGNKVATEAYGIVADDRDSLYIRSEIEVRSPGDTVGIVNASYVKIHPELVISASSGRFRRFHSLGLAHGTIEDVIVVPDSAGVHEFGQTLEMTSPDKPTPIDTHAPFDTAQDVIFDIRSLTLFYPLLARYDLDAGGVQTVSTYSPSSGNPADAQITDNGLMPVRMPNGLYVARHFFVRIGRDPANVWVDDSLRIVRITLPVQGVEALSDNYYGRAWDGAKDEDGLRTADLAIPSAGAVLAGEIVRPEGNATLPGVLIANGLGRRTRDWELVGSPLVQNGARKLSQLLARRGFATLRWDGRGVGRSTGDARSVTLEDRVADVQAAARAFAKTKGVDKKHLIIIAPDVAALGAALAQTKDVQWSAAVLIGPPGDPIDSLLFERVAATPMMPDDAAEAHEQVQRLSELIAGTDLWASWGGDSVYLPAYRQLVTRKPADVIAGFTCPVSIVVCGQDRDVPAVSTRKLVYALRARNLTGFDVAEFPLLDHYLMQLLPTAGLAELTDASRSVDEDVVGQIADWMRSKVAAPAK